MCLDSCKICVSHFVLNATISRLIYIVTSYLKCVLCNVLRQYQLPCSPCKAIMVSVDDRHDGRYLNRLLLVALGTVLACAWLRRPYRSIQLLSRFSLYGAGGWHPIMQNLCMCTIYTSHTLCPRLMPMSALMCPNTCISAYLCFIQGPFFHN